MKKFSIKGIFKSLKSSLSKTNKKTKSKTNQKNTQKFKPSNDYVPSSNLTKEESIELQCLEEFNNYKKHYLSLQNKEDSCSKKELQKAKKDCQMAEEKHYKAKMAATNKK